MRVLIVDDDPNCRQILEVMLSRMGATLAIGTNGAEGLALAETWQPDLILMDILMPEMSGIDVVKALRTTAAFASVPMVAVTALAFEHDRKEALEAGFDAVLTKPFGRRQLIEVLRPYMPGLEATETKVPA